MLKYKIPIYLILFIISLISIWLSDFNPVPAFLTGLFFTCFCYEIIIFMEFNSSHINKVIEELNKIKIQRNKDMEIIKNQEEEIIRLLKITGELK